MTNIKKYDKVQKTDLLLFIKEEKQMKALKTMISVLLAVVLAFSCIAVALAADSVEKEDNNTPAAASAGPRNPARCPRW